MLYIGTPQNIKGRLCQKPACLYLEAPQNVAAPRSISEYEGERATLVTRVFMPKKAYRIGTK